MDGDTGPLPGENRQLKIYGGIIVDTRVHLMTVRYLMVRLTIDVGTKEELCSEMGVSPRTFYRILNMMEEHLGVSIKWRWEKGKVIYFIHNYGIFDKERLLDRLQM